MQTSKKFEKTWTKKEEEFLLKTADILTRQEQAEKLDRNKATVINKLSLLRKELHPREIERPACPRCGRKKYVAKVATVDPKKDSVIKAYYCRNCLTEFRKDKTIIPPLWEEDKPKHSKKESKKESKKDQMLKLLEQGITNKEEIIQRTGMASNTFDTYMRKIKKAKKAREMTEVQEELIKAIEEIATSTGMKVDECIRQAIELLKKERQNDY